MTFASFSNPKESPARSNAFKRNIPHNIPRIMLCLEVWRERRVEGNRGEESRGEGSRGE